MTKDHWKAATLLSLAALALTNAASHYTRRTLETRITELEIAKTEATTPKQEPQPAMELHQADREASLIEALRPNERCIDHTRFKTIGNEWMQVGSC